MDLKKSFENSGNIVQVYWNPDNIGCIIDRHSAEKLWYISTMQDEPCIFADEHFLITSLGEVFDPYTKTKGVSYVLTNSDGKVFHLDLPLEARPAAIRVSRLAYHLN